MRIKYLCIFILLHIITLPVNATVTEYSDDGSVIIFSARDFLADTRRRSNKPQVSKPPENKKPKGNFDAFIQKAALKYDINPSIIHAVIRAESGYRTDVISPKGAVGLMQLMPDTAAQYDVIDLFDPEQNINVGTKHLKYLIDKYEGNLDIAFAAYNAGEGTIRKYEGIPPYPETINYVRQVRSALSMAH